VTNAPVFLPDSLRPRPGKPRKPRRKNRARRPLVAATVFLAVSLAGLALFNWRVSEVRIESCPALPACVAANLKAMRGAWVPALDLEEMQHLIDCWPGVGDCDISLQLPGTLLVRASAAPVAASIRTGCRWHALSPDGEIGRCLDQAVFPVLENFPPDPSELHRGLKAGKRVADGIGGKILSLRWVGPDDLELRIGVHDREIVLHVLPEGGPAERWFYQHLKDQENTMWADLRQADRIVVREYS